MRLWAWGLFLILVIITYTGARGMPLNPDDTKSALSLIQQSRNGIASLKTPEERILKMLELGLWKQAGLLIKGLRVNNSSRLIRAQYLFFINQYKPANILVDSVLEGSHSNQVALILKSELLIEAWDLKGSESILTDLNLKNPKNAYSKYLLGLTYLLEGKFKELKTSVSQLNSEFPDQSWSELLLGRYQLMSNEPLKADSTFQSGLVKSPLNADLRFYYGYCQWRNAKGNFLERMSAQWNVCLEINPLHYLAHWHLGNGHTLNTYSNYAEKEDSSIIRELSDFDKYILQKKYSEALQLSENIHKKHPQSVIPLLYKASGYYMSPSSPQTHPLDSSEVLFLRILEMKVHYGPAENGLAAVIKAKREPFLIFYDSILNRIQEIPQTALVNLESVIPEASYYPSLLEKMAKMEFYSSSAYFPLLKRGGYSYHIFPLHHTLAETFHSPYFNQSTTFDYRQWMDIRGVGSGAVGLEYVEKGAFFERNVLLHEFMHLVHTNLLTDQDQRKIRALYWSAMKKGQILDYYAASNEHEYFAQIYPAYFSTKAVHPQDFKSFNTVSILKTKDPEAYRFVDSLVKVETLFSQGNQTVFRDEWAELYMRLSEKPNISLESGKIKAKSYLDSASNWSPNYLPLLIARADLALKLGEQDIAETFLKKAEGLNPDYSPAYERSYELNKSLEEAGLLEYNSAFELEKSYLLKAIDVEKDRDIKTFWKQKLVNFYYANSLIPDQIQALDLLLKEIPEISSYEKDRKNLALADKAFLSLDLGYPESLVSLKKIYDTNPQAYDFALRYAQCLNLTENKAQALSILEKSLELQKSSGSINRTQALNLALFQSESGNIDRAKEIVNLALKDKVDSSLLMVKVYIGTGQLDKAEKLIQKLPLPHDFNPKSEYYSLKGDLKYAQGTIEEAISAYQDALANNPYKFQTLKKLMALLKKLNRPTAISSLNQRVNVLPVKPGPLLNLEK